MFGATTRVVGAICNDFALDFYITQLDNANEKSKHQLEIEYQKKGSLIDYFRKESEHWPTTIWNVVLLGNSGVGKSTLMNALKGVNSDDMDAAAVGVTETTLMSTCYRFSERIQIWDLPGIGSPKFPMESFFERLEIDKFDFFLILHSTRFTETDMRLAERLKEMGKMFLVVRTKVHEDITNNKRDYPISHDPKKVLEILRSNIYKNLGISINAGKVFLIDSHRPLLYDFLELTKTLSNITLTENKQAAIISMAAFCERISKKRQVLLRSTVCTTMEKYGASQMVDDNELVCFVQVYCRLYCKEFGLDENSLRETATWANADAECLKNVVCNQFSGKIFPDEHWFRHVVNTMEQLTAAERFEERVTTIPVIGRFIPCPFNTNKILLMLSNLINIIEGIALDVSMLARRKPNDQRDNNIISFNYKPMESNNAEAAYQGVDIQVTTEQALDATENITIIVFGVNRPGKSSLGNYLLGKRVFLTSERNDCVTKGTEMATCNIDLCGDKKISLKYIETPGLFDNVQYDEYLPQNFAGMCKSDPKYESVSAKSRNNQENCMKNEINRIMACSGGGIHAFLVVLAIDRYDDCDILSLLTIIEEMFGVGEHFRNYSFIVFTHADKLTTKLHHKTKRVLTEVCNGRCLFVNNNLYNNSDQETEYQVQRQYILRSILSNIQKLKHIRFMNVQLANIEMQSVKEDLIIKCEQLKPRMYSSGKEIDEKIAAVVENENNRSSVNAGLQTVSLLIEMPLAITGIALALPTFGASLAATVAGSVISIVGSTGQIANSVTCKKKQDKIIQEIETFLEPFKIYLQELCKAEGMVEKIMLELVTANPFANRSDATVRQKPMNNNFLKFRGRGMKTLLEAGAKFTALLGDDTSKQFNMSTIVGSTIAKRVPIVGTAIVGASDLFVFKNSVLKLAKNKRSKAAEEIKRKLQKLFNDFEELQKSLIADIDCFLLDPEGACQCPVCLEPWVDPVVCAYSNRHIFCKLCIAQGNKNGRQRCPICNEDWFAPIYV